MKIAIVAPCPVPYVVGGAEKLYWGLAAHINEHTPHQADIIKLPSPEADLASLMQSYEAFSTLDLGGFDLVISGKYPAWMVRHPRHVCYMLHRLRGLYDAYGGAVEVAPHVAQFRAVSSLRAFMQRYRGQGAALPEFFGRWHEVRVAHVADEGVLDFPGPLARELVHWLDDIALAPERIVRYAAISRTVAERPGYFPPGVDLAVAWPPPHRGMTPGSAQEHFYTVSRLDEPKRVGMIIDAFRRVRTGLPLVIGGSGPCEQALREAARGDARIRFAGFQNDADVREHYRRALAVPFVPYQEDYGLIAVEAMQCAKPVVTTADSGGARELVDDGVTGMVCEATVEALAGAMQRLADDPALAARMGAAALERARGVTWQAVAETLIQPVASPRLATRARARKLVVASTFAIFPPRHGGQSRIFHFYRALAPEFETVIVSVCPAAQPAFDGEIAPGVREVRVPMSREHERRERELERDVGTPVRDVAMSLLHALTPDLGKALAREASGATAVVASHPYLQPALAGLGVPLWYEAHNLELSLKTALFQSLPRGAELIEAVREVESASVRTAELILCSSPDDARELVRIYGADPGRIVDAPNGTDVERIVFTGPDERAALKEKLGFAGTSVALFMGSGHWPNIEAVKRVFGFAAELPEVAFVVVGSVCYAFDPALKPPNVLLLGEVDDITRNLCLQACDVALNPMEHGSGTNLKMLDFFAAGLPVIATDRGSRGLRLDAESQCLVREVDAFADAIADVCGAGAHHAAVRALAARELAEREFDWQVIANRLKPRLVQSLG